MKISREWLGEFIDLSGLSDEQLAERLTGIGHAVEGFERHGDDTVFEVEFTTNRIDAMSHLGVARELSAAVNRPVTWPIGADPAGTAAVAVRIDAPELCTRYSGIEVREVKVTTADPKIARRLEAVGLRTVSNVVDVTNYVMLAVGHPLHAFDLDRLEGQAIAVRAARAGETMTTLDGVERRLDSGDVVISDGARPVALGGVIGGANSEISDQTRNVFLECAHFNPAAIRRTARRLGIRTDASYRFERGADPADTVTTLRYAARLLAEIAGGTVGGLVDVVAAPPLERSILLRESTLHSATAGLVGLPWALELFRRLGMAASLGSGGVTVVVPSWRGDLLEEMDLIEEVLRFFGYNTIPPSLPRVTVGDVHHDDALVVEDRIRDLLVSAGYSEVVTYSFVPSRYNDAAGKQEGLEVTNALTENLAVMRRSLIPALLETIAHNRSYGTRDGGVFEAGRVYEAGADGAPVERHVAAFARFGQVEQARGAKRPADFFDAKAAVEVVAQAFRLATSTRASELAWGAAGESAVILHGELKFAELASVRRDLLEQFGLKAPVVAGEIDLEILRQIEPGWRMRPVSKYPGVPMVLALLHAPDLSYAAIVEQIDQLEVPFLRRVGLWDRFVQPKGERRVKTALGLWYQAEDRSLAQEEVTEAHQRLAERVRQLLPVEIVQT